jgi:hypothetical protein
MTCRHSGDGACPSPGSSRGCEDVRGSLSPEANLFTERNVETSQGVGMRETVFKREETFWVICYWDRFYFLQLSQETWKNVLLCPFLRWDY